MRWIVALLRAAVGMRLFGEAAPVDELIEAPQGIQLDGHLGDQIAHARIFHDRLAVDVGIAAVLDDALDQRIRGDAAVAAVFELHVGAGDFPAVVLAADQIFRRHAHVVEEHRVLDAHHQVHMLDRDAGKIRRDMQPGEILMAFALRIGADQRPQDNPAADGGRP